MTFTNLGDRIKKIFGISVDVSAEEPSGESPQVSGDDRDEAKRKQAEAIEWE